MGPALDVQMFPHILDHILELSDHETLTQLARTNKTIRERVFDRFLPVKHIVLHSEHGVLGVDKDNTAVPIVDKIVKKNGSAVQLIDVRKTPYSNYAPFMLGHLSRTPRPATVYFPHIRYVDNGRTDSFVTVKREPKGDGSISANATAMLPFSFQGLTLRFFQSGVIHKLLQGMFDELRLVSPGGQAALLMLRNPEHVYDDVLHNIYELLLGAGVVAWLQQRVNPVRLVFVNLEEWLRFRYPRKSVTEMRNIWLAGVKSLLQTTAASPTAVAVATLNEASFMTLEEYKRDVGAATFDICTRFVEPAFPLPQA